MAKIGPKTDLVPIHRDILIERVGNIMSVVTGNHPERSCRLTGVPEPVCLVTCLSANQSRLVKLIK